MNREHLSKVRALPTPLSRRTPTPGALPGRGTLPPGLPCEQHATCATSVPRRTEVTASRTALLGLLAALAAPLACSSSSTSPGSATDSGTAGSTHHSSDGGAGRSALPSCQNPSATRSACDSCWASKCSSQTSAANNACSTYFGCIVKCDCSDQACLVACDIDQTQVLRRLQRHRMPRLRRGVPEHQHRGRRRRPDRRPRRCWPDRLRPHRLPQRRRVVHRHSDPVLAPDGGRVWHVSGCSSRRPEPAPAWPPSAARSRAPSAPRIPGCTLP